MRTTARFIVLTFVLWGCREGFAADPKPRALEWIEPNSHRTLFTADDIVRFDWEKQLFELKRDAAIDLMMLPPALEHEFIVVADGSEICRGQLVSSFSSKTYQGPTIALDTTSIAPQPPIYQHSFGYPRDQGKARQGTKLRSALELAGVLGPLDLRQPPPPIESRFIEWCPPAHGLKIAATLFPETFRAGRDARLVLRIHKNEQFDLRADRLQLVVSLTRGAKGESVSHVAEVPVLLLDEPMAVFPWRGELLSRNCSTGNVDSDTSAGSATLRIELRAFEERSAARHARKIWTLPSVRISILPFAQPTQPPTK